MRVERSSEGGERPPSHPRSFFSSLWLDHALLIEEVPSARGNRIVGVIRQETDGQGREERRGRGEGGREEMSLEKGGQMGAHYSRKRELHRVGGDQSVCGVESVREGLRRQRSLGEGSKWRADGPQHRGGKVTEGRTK